MKMALKSIDYRIACYEGPKMVTGWAIALPPPFNCLRFCVRNGGSDWVIDHYDSGLSAGGPAVSVGCTNDARTLAYMKRWQRDGRTMESAVAWLCRYLLHLKQTKKIHYHFKRHGLEWCLVGTPFCRRAE